MGADAMRSFRQKPVGWRHESYRHYLAAKGIKTRYQQKFPDLVKGFKNENPRITKNYARFRQRDPSEFEKGSFRTKKSGEKVLILGKDRKTGKYEIQSILVSRSKYFLSKDERNTQLSNWIKDWWEKNYAGNVRGSAEGWWGWRKKYADDLSEFTKDLRNDPDFSEEQKERMLEYWKGLTPEQREMHLQLLAEGSRSFWKDKSAEERYGHLEPARKAMRENQVRVALKKSESARQQYEREKDWRKERLKEMSELAKKRFEEMTPEEYAEWKRKKRESGIVAAAQQKARADEMKKVLNRIGEDEAAERYEPFPPPGKSSPTRGFFAQKFDQDIMEGILKQKLREEYLHKMSPEQKRIAAERALEETMKKFSKRKSI